MTRRVTIKTPIPAVAEVEAAVPRVDVVAQVELEAAEREAEVEAEAVGGGTSRRDERLSPRPRPGLHPIPSCRTGRASRSHHASPNAANAVGHLLNATKICQTYFVDSTLSED